MFSITPLPEPGRYLVQVDGVGVKWTTYARSLADCRAILDRQRAAWKRRLANVKLRRGAEAADQQGVCGEEDGMTSEAVQPSEIDSGERSENDEAENKPRRVTLRACLAAIGGHEKARRAGLDRYKAAGCSLEHWRPAEQKAMADALSYAEDAVELERGSSAEATRIAIRKVRRQLEDLVLA